MTNLRRASLGVIPVALLVFALSFEARSASKCATFAVGVSEASYIISTDGTTIVAVQGATGVEEFSGSNSSTVIQAAIDALGSSGGRIVFRPGTYSIPTTLRLADHLELEGTEGVWLTSTAGAVCTGSSNSHVSIARIGVKECSQYGLYFKGGSDVRITDCTFENIQYCAVINASEYIENLWIARCKVNGAGLASTDSAQWSGIGLFKTRNLFFDGNLIESCGSNGMGAWSGSGRVVVTNNIVRLNDVNNVYGAGNGIILGGATEDMIVTGNISEYNGQNGIEVNPVSSKRVIVSSNITRGNGVNKSNADGIYASYENVIIQGNLSFENRGPGILLGSDTRYALVEGNQVWNNGLGMVGYPYHQSGIVMGQPTSVGVVQRITIRGNLVYDDQASPTQYAGIYAQSNCDGLTVEDNTVYGSLKYAIYVPGNANNRVANNLGYVTENSGSATLIAGGTVLVVSHGLSVTPDLSRIHVTPQSNLGGRSFWVSAATSTTFQIEISSSETSDLTFGWRAE